MHLKHITFVTLAAILFFVACGNGNGGSSEFGQANSINVGNGALTPQTDTQTPAQTEPVEGSINHLTFATLDNTAEQTFAAHLNQPLVVNFFAAWCGPCRAELPDFEAVYGDLAQHVNFLGISRDSYAEQALGLLAETGVSFPTGWDQDGTLFAEFGLFSMPSTLFVDTNGSVVEQWSGVLSAERLRALITEHLL